MSEMGGKRTIRDNRRSVRFPLMTDIPIAMSILYKVEEVVDAGFQHLRDAQGEQRRWNEDLVLDGDDRLPRHSHFGGQIRLSHPSTKAHLLDPIAELGDVQC